MPNAGEANSAAHDAAVNNGTPAPAEVSDDELRATAEEKLAQAEQHLADAKEAKSHWTKILNRLRR
jgi:hypothetical protein